ncbi:MAG: ChaB family protein [Elainellaceae cyanobacterium]
MATETYKAEKTVSAVFESQQKVSDVIQRLLDRGVTQEHISALGRNFETETRITGFISKKDVILGGLRTGAVFGSLFGSLLSLLTGVGVIFVPFIGSLVAGGPIGAVLLGAASGALAGSAGAGIASALATLGMPEDKAAIYETRLKSGEYVVMAEVSADRVGEFQLLMESAGGEEIHTLETALPRACSGRCEGPESLSPEVRSHLSEAAQSVFIERYNSAYDETNDEMQAEQAAWSTVRDQFDEDDNGVYSKGKVSA